MDCASSAPCLVRSLRSLADPARCDVTQGFVRQPYSMRCISSPRLLSMVEVAPRLAVLVSIMRNETPSSELIRLHKEQRKTQEDEVFGGLSPEERAGYEIKQDRIHDLERVVPEPVHSS
jgi:hypothetical protein